MSQKLIFATANQHKLDEIRKILPSFEILGLKDIDIVTEIEETGDTLEENALIKARYLYERVGAISLSEDTGLEVAAIGGRPGVHTARFAGDDRDPIKNMNLLLHELADKVDRSAQFRTVIACISDQGVQYFEGIVRGKIAATISGVGGFGYDPIFIPEGYDQTFAELSAEIKSTISHRARAVNALIAFLHG